MSHNDPQSLSPADQQELLIYQYKAQCMAVIQQIAEYQHKTKLLKQETNKIKKHSEQLQAQNNQLQNFLNKFEVILKNLQSENKNQISEDKQFWDKHTKLASEYGESLTSEEEIMRETVMSVPQKSLDQLEQFYSGITTQKVTQAIRYGMEKKEILEKMQSVRERFQKVQQKCRGLRSRSKNKANR